MTNGQTPERYCPPQDMPPEGQVLASAGWLLHYMEEERDRLSKTFKLEETQQAINGREAGSTLEEQIQAYEEQRQGEEN